MTIYDLPFDTRATARDAQIFINNRTLPGDTIVAHNDLPQVVDNDPTSSTYGTVVHLTLKGRKLRNTNPISDPHVSTYVPKGYNDGKPVVVLKAAQDPRTGNWGGAELQGFTVRGGNQQHLHSSSLPQDQQGQVGIAVDPRPRDVPWGYQNLCKATLCTISEVMHDGYGGPGGTLACTIEWACRMGQLMHYDGTFMLHSVVRDCKHTYAMEAYGAAVHTIHGVRIEDNTFGGIGGYIDSPIAAGNGYEFGIRFLRNHSTQADKNAGLITQIGPWAANAWNFNGFLSSDVEIGWNTFEAGWTSTCAVEVDNTTGVDVHDNTIPCVGPFAYFHNCKFPTAERNVGGPKMTAQSKVI